ncbi:MAG TPA: lipid-A-disaccharide synthase, partial [Crenotrichaceae bacterium]|nr:lipid-A-disaccharide synthase [Crenotrichaceae bacterium]
PGSRHNEIRRLFPVMLKAADLLRERYPQAQFVLPKASNIDEQVFDRYREDCCATINQCKAGDYNLLQCCDIAISASGTATLELALLSMPMVIVYKVAPLTYWFAKRLVRIPFIGLPNILAGQSIVPELIQDQVNMRNLVDEVSNILDDKARVDQIKQQLSELRLSFGEQDGIESLAELAENVLRSK